MARNISTPLHVPLKDHQWPIIYSPEYNIALCGIERLQAYDTCKGSNIFAFLKGKCVPVYITVLKLF